MTANSDVRVGRKRTVLRTVRITEDLDELLRESAEDRNMSVSALIYSILTKYAEWDRSAERMEFITIASETFKRLLEAVDEKKLIEIGQTLGFELPKGISLFFFKEANIEALLELISLYSKYSGLVKCEIETDEENIIVYHHELGRNWSIFMRYFIGEAIKTMIGTTPECEISESQIIFRFRASGTPKHT